MLALLLLFFPAEGIMQNADAILNTVDRVRLQDSILPLMFQGLSPQVLCQRYDSQTIDDSVLLAFYTLGYIPRETVMQLGRFNVLEATKEDRDASVIRFQQIWNDDSTLAIVITFLVSFIILLLLAGTLLLCACCLSRMRRGKKQPCHGNVCQPVCRPMTVETMELPISKYC